MQTSEATRTLAFLFTDIEGSSGLWERFPESMRASLERHDAILRGAVEGAGGAVVKTTGDGVMAVFGAVRDGVRACLRAQLELADETWNETGPLRVRMGVHAGEAAADDGDYHGPAVNRAARVMAAGHGGQVLLSAVAAELIVDELPEGSALLDLGEHHLKSLGRPERIFQLVHPGLPAEFPALATVHDRARGLPVETSGLIGREHELTELEERLRADGARLVTLLGPGGIGKTRLALRAAATLSGVFDGGVLFVDLAAARGASSVLVAIARTVGLPDAGQDSQLDELVASLRDRRCLVVLDNFEQVAAAASTVARLLTECPGLKVLVTSREALNIQGEQRFPVPPLSLPDTAARQPSAEQLVRYDAIRLFVERAQAIRPDFRLTDENAAAVSEICLRLDGLPLAIELAAGRIGVFSPEGLRERLGSRLTALGSGPRDLPERQQTLRATIDWSYELLDPGEQRLFELLSAFAGARLEAVAAVAGDLDGRPGGVETVDEVASLVDKSLLGQVDAGDGGTRFVMLETVREYAAERLHARPDVGGAARRAHALYFAELIRSHADDLTGAGRAAATATLAPEAENLRLCWRYWVGEQDLEQLNGLVDVLWSLYEGQGWYGAAIELASDLLGVLESTPSGPEHAATESMLRLSQARALMAMDGFTAAVEAQITNALELIERDGERPRLFPVLRSLGAFYNYRSEFEKSAQIGREIQALADAENDASMRLDGDLQLAASLGFLGDLREASELLESAIGSFEEHGYRPSRLRTGSDARVPCLTTSALYLWLLGFPDRSLARADRAVELATTLGHPFTCAYAHFHSGLLHLWRREPGLVRARALGTLEIADSHDLPVWTATGTVLLGAALSELGEAEEGLATVREGIGLYQEMKTPPVFWPMLLGIDAGACARAGLTDDALTRIDEALALVGADSRLPLRPELLLIKGDVLAGAGRATGDGAAQCFERALSAAEALDARTTQLRAAVRLCRVSEDAAQAEQSRRRLEAVYATFTEGFETAELVDARALLAPA